MTTKANLNGLRILNTRPATPGDELNKQIIIAQGVPVSFPLLEIHELQSWIKELPDLHTVHQAIFISSNAVRFFFKHLKLANVIWPLTLPVITLGQASKNSLKQFGITSIISPLEADSEHLLTLENLQNIENQVIMIVKGKDGRPMIEQVLLERNAKLVTLEVYQRQIPKINPQLTQSIWRDDRVDIILLTSEQSILNLFQLLVNDKAQSWLRSKTCLVISKRLEQIAFKLGITHIIRCHPDEMIPALIEYASKD